MFRHHRNKGLISRAAIEQARSEWCPRDRVTGECNDGGGRHPGAGLHADLGEDALAQLISTNVGRRTHRLIAELADVESPNVVEAVDRLLKVEPIPGAVRAAARLQVTQMVNVYLKLLKPRDAQLIAAEMTLTGCVADLVWKHTSGLVVIDEVKSGPPASVSKPPKQIRNLALSGHARWGADFVGVRRCPLLIPSKTLLYAGEPTVTVVAPPQWLEVRS